MEMKKGFSALSEKEMYEVNGGSFWGIVGAVVGAVIGSVLTLDSDNDRRANDVRESWIYTCSGGKYGGNTSVGQAPRKSSGSSK